MAPPRKSLERHLAEGTFRPHRHGAGTPVVVGGRGRPPTPRHLAPAVASIFDELADRLGPVLDVADGPLIEAAASMLGRMRAASADLAARGQLLEVVRIGRDGARVVRLEPNPSVRIAREAGAEFRLLADRLGIGPASRVRLAGLGVEGKPAAEAFDELAEFRAARRAADLPPTPLGGPRSRRHECS